RSGSFENMLHHESNKNRLIVFDRRTDYDEVLPHRAIGVVYNPGREFGNYVPSVVNKRYDAFIYLDETTALHSLQIRPTGNQVPETYPFEV
ncbi:MAG TPA: erythromycin esterase family protein, partial [Bacteroidia bacterium]|nr:erythromycin esterase family protein [Bacteroidia bacterium]